MKIRHLLVLCGLACGLLPRLAADEHGFWAKLFPPLPSTDKGPVACVFYVTTLTGHAECIADGRIFDLKRGDKVLARGARVTTGDKSKVALVFSNQTTIFLDQHTEIRVDKFEQEPFTPNNNLLIEPSNSQMEIYVSTGQMVIATPQLLSGTRMVFESPHAAVVILNGQSGGEKGFLEVSPEQTHFAMIQGRSDIFVRGQDGELASLGRTLNANTQAFVKFTLNGNGREGNNGAALAVTSGGAAAAAAGVTAETAAPPPRPAPSSVTAETAGVHPELDQFIVTKVVGTAECNVRGQTVALKAGDTLSLSGADFRTAAGSKMTVVLSNLTCLSLGEKTDVSVAKFDQEGFEPTTNLDIEPSNSTSFFIVGSGLLDISTPQLLSGTSMVFESAHGAVKFLPVQSGGDQATLHVTAKQTEVQLVIGKATATPRAPDGTLVSIGQTLGPGDQAVIKPTLGNTLPAGPELALGQLRVVRASGAVAGTVNGVTRALRSGDTLAAAGASFQTAAGARATLLLSNLASLDLGEKTDVTIDRFVQAPFAAFTRMDLEPSISQSQITVHQGVLTLATPRLLEGSSQVFRTPQGAVNVIAAESGGDQGSLDVTAKQTDFQLVAGNAVAYSLAPDGRLVGTGQTVGAGEEAVIQPVLGGRARGNVLADADALTHVAVRPAPVIPPNATLVTQSTEADVLRLEGTASLQLPRQHLLVAVTPGMLVPVGSVIATGADSAVTLEPYVGAIGVIKANSRIVVEKIEVVTNAGAVVRREAILDCQKGTIISMIDPAMHNINTYSVRTPKGLATAHGTSFSVSVSDTNSDVATTADAVTFSGTDGSAYTVSAGYVTFTPAGGSPQPPVPLSQAVAADPAFAGVVNAAVAAVSTLVQNNVGNLSAGSAANLLSQVVGVAAAAIPAQAANFVTEAVTAVSTPGSSTGNSSAIAAAAVTAAACAAAPAQNSQVAAAASAAAPALSSTVTAAAAQVAADQSGQGSSSGNSAVGRVVQATAVTVSQITGGTTVAAGNGGGSANGGGGGTGGNFTGGGNNGNNNGSNGGNGGGGGTRGGPDQQTSVVITQVNGGSADTVTTTTAETTTTSGATAQPTSITITQLNGGLLSQINGDLAEASTAQSSVTFTTSGSNTTTGPTSTVNTVPTSPSNLPINNGYSAQP